MKLSHEEEEHFQKIYNRLKRKTSNNLTSSFCLKLMIFRASIPEPIAKKVIYNKFPSIYFCFKIWSFVTFNNDQKKSLDQTHFFILLKYIAGVQNGLCVSEINPLEIGSFPLLNTSIKIIFNFKQGKFLPNFPKPAADDSIPLAGKAVYDSRIVDDNNNIEELEDNGSEMFLKGVPVDVSKIVNDSNNLENKYKPTISPPNGEF